LWPIVFLVAAVALLASAGSITSLCDALAFFSNFSSVFIRYLYKKLNC
jgi:hypothetical protein